MPRPCRFDQEAFHCLSRFSPFRLQKTFMPTSRQYSHKFLPFYTDTDKEQ
jgi:hypothetical protein